VKGWRWGAVLEVLVKLYKGYLWLKKSSRGSLILVFDGIFIDNFPEEAGGGVRAFIPPGPVHLCFHFRYRFLLDRK